MAKNPRTEPVANGNVVIADGEPLNLYNRHLAAFLGWLLPGAGHYYQGRKFKAAIYFSSVMMCLVIGLVVSGGRCVYASWNGTEKRWQFALQAGVGLPAIPAAVQGWRKSNGKAPLLEGWFFGEDRSAPFSAPLDTRQLDDWHQRTASGFELGTLYTMIAGLLNILAVYDAFSGPLPAPTSGGKKEGSPNEGDASASSST